ncbi:MAG: cation:proton antiporter [Gemmatimonadales bacterium]
MSPSSWLSRRPSWRSLLVVFVGVVLLAPPPLWAAADSPETIQVFRTLAGILVGAKLLGELCERLGQPAVLGELLAGVILGPSVLNFVPTGDGFAAGTVELLAGLGVVLLLFEVGLETDLKAMFKVGPAAASVALIGVVLPFAGGYAFWVLAPHPAEASPTLVLTALFVGATLTATSVGITARILGDLGWLHSVEARVVLGAAVIDDIVGLVILSIVGTMAAGGTVSPVEVLRILGLAVGFLVVAVFIGNRTAPAVFDLVHQMRTRQTLAVLAFAFVLAISALATRAGSALIIGAFAGGLILSTTRQHKEIEQALTPLAAIFAPIFFVKVGAALDLSLLNPATPGAGALLATAGVLTVIAVLGKLLTGWGAPWQPFDRLTVGLGMVPRGEVGLIFADLGLRTGVLDQQLFGAVVIMVMATTFLAPIALKLRLKGKVPPPAVEG